MAHQAQNGEQRTEHNLMNSLRDSRAEADKSPLERILTRVIRLQWWLFLVLGLVGGLFYYLQPIDDPTDLRALVAEAKETKKTLATQRSNLLQRIDWLKTEPEYLEIAAQDKLLRGREGEKVIRFK